MDGNVIGFTVLIVLRSGDANHSHQTHTKNKRKKKKKNLSRDKKKEKTTCFEIDLKYYIIS